MIFFRQSLVILLATGITLLFKTVFPNIPTPFLLGALVFFYITVSRFKQSGKFNLFILISLVLVLISSTGDISSPFFFLLYLLSFTIGFFFDPKIVFVFAIALIILLFPSSLKTDVTRNLLLLFSLFLLSPLAFFLGKSYQENRKTKKKIETIKKRARKIENDVEEVLYDDRQRLSDGTAEKLNEALIESEDIINQEEK